jgi:hypothetical protein
MQKQSLVLACIPYEQLERKCAGVSFDQWRSPCLQGLVLGDAGGNPGD